MRLVRKFLLLVLALVVALALAEIALRLIGVPAPGRMPLPEGQLPGMVVLHPVRGFACAPDFRGEVVRAGRANTIRLNERGFRDRSFAAEPGTRVVLAVGDSFTAGWGLEEEETWPRRLEARLNAGNGAPWRVLNAGVAGYNMRQARLTAEELIPEVKPQVVVLGVYPMGFDRLANPFVAHDRFLLRESQIPFVVVEPDALLHTPFRRPWLKDVDFWCNRHLVVGALILRTLDEATKTWRHPRPPLDTSAHGLRRAMAPLLAEVGLLRDAAQRAGAGFVALSIAIQAPAGDFDPGQDTLEAGVVEYCAAEGIPCVPTLSVLRERSGGKPIYHLPDDLHWTPAANEIAAELLAPLVGQ